MIKKFNKRGIAVVIGYILLVVTTIVMGGVTYSVVKTYIPKNTPECPSDTSLLIRQAICSDGNLKLTFENRGLFDIHGFYIRAKETPESKLATVNLNPNSEDGLYTFNNPVKPSSISDEIKIDFDTSVCGENNGYCSYVSDSSGKCVGKYECEKDPQDKKNCEKLGCTYVNPGTLYYNVNSIEILPVVKMKNDDGRESVSVCSPAKITETIQYCNIAEKECPDGTSLEFIQSVNLIPTNLNYVAYYFVGVGIPGTDYTPGGTGYPHETPIILKDQTGVKNRRGSYVKSFDLNAGRYKVEIKKGAWRRTSNMYNWESTANVVWKDTNSKLTLFRFGTSKFYPNALTAQTNGQGKGYLFNHNGGKVYLAVDDSVETDNTWDNKIGPVVVDIYQCKN